LLKKINSITLDSYRDFHKEKLKIIFPVPIDLIKPFLEKVRKEVKAKIS